MRECTVEEWVAIALEHGAGMDLDLWTLVLNLHLIIARRSRFNHRQF
jgi:hypothetical protein